VVIVLGPKEPTLTAAQFAGISNKADSETFGIRAFTAGDNVDIDATGKHLSTRDGRTQLTSTAFVSAFSTYDGTRCYAVTAAGILISWVGSAAVMRSGFVGYPYWCQIADVVFVGNENQCWRIGPDGIAYDNAITPPAAPQLSLVPGTLPPGQYRFVQVGLSGKRESAASLASTITTGGSHNIQVSGITGDRVYVCPADSRVFQWWRDTSQSTLVYARAAETLGEELRTNNLLPMPAGRCVTQYEGRLYCSLYNPRTDQSAVFRSLPFWWDLCEPTDFKLVPGEIRAMAGLAEGLIIGTDRQIVSMDAEGAATTLADYGVPPGQPISLDVKVPGEAVKECWIWTQRGVCKALPFAEIAPHFAPPLAAFTGSAVVRKHGDERFVVTLSPSGAPDNVN
jgi:hypothetical protein